MLGRGRIIKKVFPYIFLISIFAFSFVPFFAFGSGIYSPPIVMKLLAKSVSKMSFPTFWAEIRLGPINCSNERTDMRLIQYMEEMQNKVENNGTIKRMGAIVAKFLEIKVMFFAKTSEDRRLEENEMILNVPSPSLYKAFNTSFRGIKKVSFKNPGPYYFYVLSRGNRIQVLSLGGSLFQRAGIIPISPPMDLSSLNCVLIFFNTPQDLSEFLSSYFSSLYKMSSRIAIVKLVIANTLGVRIPNFKGVKELSEAENVISNIAKEMIPKITLNEYLKKYVPTPILRISFFPVHNINMYVWAKSHVEEVIYWMEASSGLFFGLAILGVVVSSQEYYLRMSSKIEKIESKIRIRGIAWRSSKHIATLTFFILFLFLVFVMWAAFYTFFPNYANYLIWIGAALCLLGFIFSLSVERSVTGIKLPFFLLGISLTLVAITYVKNSISYWIMSIMSNTGQFLYFIVLLFGVYSIPWIVDLLLNRKFKREYDKNVELMGIGGRGIAILLSIIIVSSLVNFGVIYSWLPINENKNGLKLAAMLFPTWFSTIYLSLILISVVYFVIKAPFVISILKRSVDGMKRRGIPPKGIFIEIWKEFLRLPLLRFYLMLFFTFVGVLLAVDSYIFTSFSFIVPSLSGGFTVLEPKTRLIYALGLYNPLGLLALLIPFFLYGPVLIYLGVRSLWKM